MRPDISSPLLRQQLGLPKIFPSAEPSPKISLPRPTKKPENRSQGFVRDNFPHRTDPTSARSATDQDMPGFSAWGAGLHAFCIKLISMSQ